MTDEKWIKTDEYSYPERNSGVKIYSDNDETKPAMSINQDIQPQNDRSAGETMRIVRVGGVSGSARFTEYRVEAIQDSGYDVAESTIATSKNLQGGNILAKWDVVAGPSKTDTDGGIIGKELNVFERRGDQGKKEKRSDGNFTAGKQYVPESCLNVGDGNEVGYNVSFQIVIARSGEHPDRQCASTLS